MLLRDRGDLTSPLVGEVDRALARAGEGESFYVERLVIELEFLSS